MSWLVASAGGKPSNKKSAAAMSWAVPVGFVRTEDHRLEKMADRQVQQALDGVFKKLRELGSARQTMRWDRDAALLLPEVHPGTAGHDIIWQRPSGHRIHQMLTNPCSAGALVYGHRDPTVIEDGRARQSTRRTKPLEQWRIVLLEQHPGDISWDMFLQNQQLLEGNRACQQKQPVERPNGTGVAQWLAAGAAAASSRSSIAAHRARATGRAGGRVDRGSSSCLTVGGLRVDPAVTAAVLEALQPAGPGGAWRSLVSRRPMTRNGRP